MPPVEVIRTVEAVTAPVLLAGPKAVTQSPTASAVADVDWVSDKVVEDAVVILSFCVLSLGGFEPDLPVALLVDRLNRVLSNVPDSEMVDPLTALTLPLAMARFARPANDRPAP